MQLQQQQQHFATGLTDLSKSISTGKITISQSHVEL
jgi:hypothetical protein